MGKGAPSSSKGGAQAGAATWCSPLFSPSWAGLVCIPLGFLAPSGARPPGRDGLFPSLSPLYLFNPSSFCGQRDQLRWVEGVVGWEALSGLPSHQVGTLEALGEMIFACVESPFLQEW